jgi:putative iron-dependent peroxidase
MSSPQPGILGDVPRLARYLSFTMKPASDPRDSLHSLCDSIDGNDCVVGLGTSLVTALEGSIDGLRNFEVRTGNGIDIPSTPSALWLWLRGDDRGELLHLSRDLQLLLAPAFELEQVIDAFQHKDSRDLTGYEDGTENPEGEEALAAAIVQGKGEGLDGSSFVAVQQWLHDLDSFQAMPQQQQDHTIGRRISDNEEIEDAPESAHVKRTAQEDFEPEAFVLRRSMPWAEGQDAGLVFVAFGHSFDAYEALLNRMIGGDDGITDALFDFTRPLTGAYYWCPPMKEGKPDLQAVGL